ncbi:MAG: PspC domain-containing protein [Patescibacteria group bacterium]|nr:MAG: PspC domain-containing protein [Patescibacteria group bacterium]
MDDEDKRPPRLRPEVELPPDSTDTFQLFKTLKKTDGQYIRWRRLPAQGWYMGVCAGLAKRYGLPRWKVRLYFLAGLLVAGLPIVYYVLATAFVPAEGEDGAASAEGYEEIELEDDSAGEDPKT